MNTERKEKVMSRHERQDHYNGLPALRNTSSAPLATLSHAKPHVGGGRDWRL